MPAVSGVRQRHVASLGLGAFGHDDDRVLTSADGPLLEMADWLIRLRMVTECFVLSATDLAAMRLKIGMVFQDFRLLEHLSVFTEITDSSTQF